MRCQRFDKNVDNLPKNLTHLTFGMCFNQKVDRLPKKLTHLTFGWCFNQKVNNLPKIIMLNFDAKLSSIYGYSLFNKSIDKLPETIKCLTTNYNFDMSKSPQNLCHLEVNDLQEIKNINMMPKTITKFDYIFGKNEVIPDNLDYIILVDNIKIPQNIKKIIIDCDNILINNLPNHIEKIFINFENCKKKQVSNLPITIKEIIIKNEKYKKYLINIIFDVKIIIQPNFEEIKYCEYCI